MECDRLHGTMLDAAARMIPRPPDFQAHLRDCDKCSLEFEALRRTMDLLDEWRVPDPSQGFDGQFREKLGRAKTGIVTGWLVRLRPTIIAFSVATILFTIAITIQLTQSSPISASFVEEHNVGSLSGSAVGDLQALDEADELLADFDLVDHLAPDEAH